MVESNKKETLAELLAQLEEEIGFYEQNPPGIGRLINALVLREFKQELDRTTPGGSYPSVLERPEQYSTAIRNVLSFLRFGISYASPLGNWEIMGYPFSSLDSGTCYYRGRVLMTEGVKGNLGRYVVEEIVRLVREEAEVEDGLPNIQHLFDYGGEIADLEEGGDPREVYIAEMEVKENPDAEGYISVVVMLPNEWPLTDVPLHDTGLPEE